MERTPQTHACRAQAALVSGSVKANSSASSLIHLLIIKSDDYWTAL
jgi:hypothetical protein